MCKCLNDNIVFILFIIYLNLWIGSAFDEKLPIFHNFILESQEHDKKWSSSYISKSHIQPVWLSTLCTSGFEIVPSVFHKHIERSLEADTQ